ncbi:hypothetical protein CHS0354_004440 [Potamilus streckersoni]|uniref:Sodium/potassium-transporting ATPase subunit beta n=1 Tax=Potamilus streckersoni TaxID=2493646 RepID=A0AAE0SHU7_9BIVA|nr:hypothetical protein CHS0354_004440 [Potamilus streckersoni]
MLIFKSFSIQLHCTTIDPAVPWYKKPTLRSRYQDFATFLFDPEESTILGRTAGSWGQICLFYLIFYLCLAGFFASMMVVFYSTLDWNVPRLRGADSILRQGPGLGMRPLADVGTTLIRLNKAKPASFQHHQDNVQGFLAFYENDLQRSETGSLIDCESVDGFRRPEDWNKACRFDVLQLGADCVKQQGFGLEDGLPCILLKINNIYDWIPELYTNETVPDEIRENWAENHITVQCEGENPADKDNIGPIAYYPPYGFHVKYFPFRNQQGYRSPLVFVRFDGPVTGVLIMVTCKIYARNIYHDSNEKSGQIHFEMIVD